MLALTFAAALLAVPAGAQRFGQNHVVLKDFEWRVRSTEHFDLYYYPGCEPIVPLAAQYLEKAFETVMRRLEIAVDPPIWASEKARKRRRWARRPFFLFAHPNDFLQNNIAIVGEGTGGVTEPFKDRFLVYNDGSRQWLEEVITHEFTHVAQFHVLVSGFWRSGRILKTIVYPLWWMEGMPGYITHGIESTLEETTIRDAATSGGLIPLVKLEHFGHLKPHQITLAYKQGAAALEFLGSQYGRRKIGEMLRLFESRIETSQVLTELIGLDAFEFDRKYREFLETRYRREVRVERLREPEAFGGALTRTEDNIPQFNSSPVFSPDGRTMYYLSTAASYPVQLRALDLRTGKIRRLRNIGSTRIENIPLGNFANLSRVLDISPDGRGLVFAGSKNLSDALYFYDLKKRRLQRRFLSGFMRVAQPRFSPDGRRVVFSGMKDSLTDIYVYDMVTGRVDRVTEDKNDDEMPVFSADGRSVIFSSEVSDPLDPERVERRLYSVSLDNAGSGAGRQNAGERRRLENVGSEARDPVVSPDGRRVLFVLDGGGFSELAELSLETGRVTRLTRSIGGSFTPTYAPDGEIAFASLRRGNVHLYKGPRADFLLEPVPARKDEPSAPMKFMLPGMGSVGRSTEPAVALSPERPYRFQYSTDLFIPAFFYSSIGGFFWTSYWQGSDLLGNHQNAALVNFHSGRSYDYAVQYGYSRFRPQIFAALEGSAREDLLDVDTDRRVDDSLHVLTVGARYPLDRAHRLEAGVRAASERVVDHGIDSVDDRQGRAYFVGAVRDAVRGRYLVANSGNRLAAQYTQSAVALGGNRRYQSFYGEAQQFAPLGSQGSLFLRAAGVHSVGPESPQYVLGGLGGVRGYGRSTSQDFGSRLALGTAELRFPVVPDLNYHMWYFFPDFYFKAIFGTLFTDAGYAWSTREEFNALHWRDVRNSVGVGLRIYTFILQQFPLVLFMDYAHRTTQNGGIFYVYLGSLF